MADRKPIVLVTGAAGFLGIHSIEKLLAKGYRVRALDRPDFTSRLACYAGERDVSVDSRDLFDIDPEDNVFTDIDSIIHCAGIADHRASFDNPESYMRANVQSLVRVLDAARRRGGIRVIHPSSAAVYGQPDWPTREDHPIAPANPYGLSKCLAEQAALHWYSLYGISTISFRIFNGYGPRTDDSHGLVGAFLKRTLAGQAVTVMGDGRQRRDFIHVSDIVDAFICALESDRAGEIYNLGSGQPESILTLAELMGAEIEFRPARDGEVEVTCADMGKIKAHLDWEPRIPIVDGVKSLLETARNTVR